MTLSANDGSGFQQKIDVDSNTNSSYYGSTLSNVNWQDGAGNILYSRLESGETNTSTDSVYFVKLPNASITVVYQVLYDTAVNSMDGSVTGAEPMYTGTYGQYDNGTSVFPTYIPFGGLSILPSPFGEAGDTANLSVTFNATYTRLSYTGAAWAGISGTPTSSMTTYPTVIEAYSAWSSDYSEMSVSSAQIGAGAENLTARWAIEYLSSTALYLISANSIIASKTSGNPTSGSLHLWGIQLASGTSAQGVYLDYASLGLSGTLTAETDTYFRVELGDSTAQTDLYWIRTRAYPAGGTMPTTSFGSISNIITYIETFTYNPSTVETLTRGRVLSEMSSATERLYFSPIYIVNTQTATEAFRQYQPRVTLTNVAAATEAFSLSPVYAILAQYSPASPGNYQLDSYFRITNATTNVTLRAFWSDGSGANSFYWLDGVNMEVDSYMVQPLYITANSLSAITIQIVSGTAGNAYASASISSIG